MDRTRKLVLDRVAKLRTLTQPLPEGEEKSLAVLTKPQTKRRSRERDLLRFQCRQDACVPPAGMRALQQRFDQSTAKAAAFATSLDSTVGSGVTLPDPLFPPVAAIFESSTARAFCSRT